jgi:hypothetical protein
MIASPQGAPAVPPADPPAVLPGFVAALIGAAALIAVMAPLLWPLAQHFNVMAHEGAHALMGSVLGIDPTGVTINLDTGATSFWSPEAGARWALTGFVGYLGPSLFGLGAAKLIETGRTVTVLWLAILLLVLLLLLLRKSLGIVSVPAAIALLALVTRNAHAGLEEVVSYSLAWVLLLSGLRVAIAHGVHAGDAHALSAETHVPRRVWALLWLAGALLAVVIGGKWLVLRS